MRSKLTIILFLVLFFTSCKGNKKQTIKKTENVISQKATKEIKVAEDKLNNCILPKEIKNYFTDSIKNLSENDLGEWKISPNLDSINCPTFIVYDFDKNAKPDFIGIVKYMKEDFPKIIFIKDFQENNKISEIGFVKDYGDHIGTVIYLNKTQNGFMQNNLESSLIEYTWNGLNFDENFIAD